MFEPGRGVGVRAEGQAVALQNLHHLALGHVLGAVERHMLDKMGQPLLGIAFGDRSEIDMHADGRAVFGRFIVLDGVFHAIGQDAVGYRRIGHDVGLRHAPAGGLRCGAALRGGRLRCRRGGLRCQRCGEK